VLATLGAQYILEISAGGSHRYWHLVVRAARIVSETSVPWELRVEEDVRH
jgi:hypothetical protein